MSSARYDLLVIGAGAAGGTAATTAASKGAKVALLERDKPGGTCLNYGCDPTKTLLAVASTLYHAQHAASNGIEIAHATLDWSTVQQHVHKVLDQIRGGSPDDARASIEKQGIHYFQGEASFLNAHELTLHGQTLAAERILIATGCKALIPPIEGLEQAGYITNVEAISLPQLPRRLAIVGAGAIGLEFAQMFQRFGVSVTILEREPLILPDEDRELADQLAQTLRQEGIHLETGAELQRVEKHSSGKRLTYAMRQGKQETLEVDELLLALGRQPALEALHLERAGVEVNKKGVVVNEVLQTSVPHIWAAGDITGGYQFTHVASEQGKLAAQNAFSSTPRAFDDRVIPWVIYTEPALAHLGKTEEQLQKENVAYHIGRKQFSSVERALTSSQGEGQVKLLVDQEHQILGAHILGTHADDLLAPIIVAMRANLPTQALAESIFPYPTFSEGVRWAAVDAVSEAK